MKSQKPKKQIKYWYLILILLIIPSVLFFFTKGTYWLMHDDMQMVRQMELEKCLTDGQIPCRWTPDLGFGYGYPLFNFYPPLPYIIGQTFRFMGFSFMQTVKLTTALQFFAAGFSMYLLASLFFGQFGGLLSSLFFVYAPYHAINIFIRGAMNEAWASVFFPLIFYFVYKIINEKKIKNIILLALSYTGLFLSHNPMVLTFTPFVALWALFWLFQKKELKNTSIYLNFAKSAIISLSLSAFFTIPALIETKYVQIDTMFNNYYTWSAHFVSLRQLFISLFWGNGGSIWGPNDGMPFMVGYLHWILPILVLIFLVIKKRFDNNSKIFYLLSFFALTNLFLTHERSTFIWKLLPVLQKIQFPWRLLNLSTFFLSFVIGIIPSLFAKNKKHFSYVLPVLITLLFIFNFKYFKPIESGPLTDSQKFSGKAWVNQVTSGIYDYLPNTASRAPSSPARFPIDAIVPKETKYDVTGLKQGSDWIFFNIKTDVSSVITVSQFAFPNFKIFNNGQEIKYGIEKELGRMTININPGNNQIYIKLYNTPIRIITNYISLFSWIALILFVFRNLWKPLIFKK